MALDIKKQDKTLSKTQAIHALWRRGSLSWKLRPDQKEIYNLLKKATGMKYTLYCSRRYGKSYISVLMALEDALQGPNRSISYVAPTQIQVKKIIFPLIKEITKDCPEELKPKFDRELGCYVFTNGSEIHLAGTDNKRYENLLGMTLYRGYCDEPGTMTDLGIIVKTILQPQTLTTTRTEGPAIILLGTPAPSVAHDYFFIKEECKSAGNFARRTIYDNTFLTKQKVEEYIEEAGGINSTNCRREYFCEDVTDEKRAIIPEYSEEKDTLLAKELPIPKNISWYVAMDPGGRDFTGIVFGFYDFLKDEYRIEDELLLIRQNTAEVAEEIKKKEVGLNVALRVSDTDPQTINDLSTIYGLDFVPTKKDNKVAQINQLRMLVQKNKIFINPRCVNLRRQFRSGLWNNARTEFIRTEAEGHFDLIDAVIYLIRNIDIWSNPNPEERRDYSTTHYTNNNKQETNIMSVLFQD